MKKLLLLCACLLALGVCPSVALAVDPEVVVMRVWDNGGPVRVAITRGDKQEYFEFDGGYSEKSLKAASKSWQELIQKLYREGFRLQSTFAGQQAINSTLIFVKGD